MFDADLVENHDDVILARKEIHHALLSFRATRVFARPGFA